MSGPFRVSGTNGRVAPFCERCGRVAGPLPYGRGEILLTTTADGTFCDEHLEVRHDVATLHKQTPRVNVKVKQDRPVEIQTLLDFIAKL